MSKKRGRDGDVGAGGISPNKKRKRTSDVDLNGSDEQIPDIYTDGTPHNFTCQQLRSVCRLSGWTGHNRLRKHALAEMVAAKLRQSQQALFDHDRKLVARPMGAINVQDAITQADLSDWDHEYLFAVESHEHARHMVRRVYLFDPVSLVTMILRTGSLANPFNRQPFTAADLWQLEHKYTSVLRAGAAAPVEMEDLLHLRPDMSAELILPRPTREQIGLDATEVPPEPVDGYAPWLTGTTLVELAKDAEKKHRQQREYEETLGWLVSQLRRTAESTFDYLSGVTGGVSSTLRCSMYLEVCMRLFLPMLLESVKELCDFDVACMWAETKRIAEHLRMLGEHPSSVVIGTAAVCMLAMLVDFVVMLIRTERRRPRSADRTAQVNGIYREVRQWDQRHSSSVVIRTSLRNQLVRLIACDDLHV